MIRFSELPDITKGEMLSLSSDRGVETIITDSRKAIAGDSAVFFAIKGLHHDGHKYIEELYRFGVKQFVVESPYQPPSGLTGCNFFRCASTLTALQDLVAFHRSKLGAKVLGITGSNGKTIIKEWLYQLLSDDYRVVKNPGSYNSQLGVPLSVWQLQPHHDVGIFEAGISRRGEMHKLHRVIMPHIGIFTNLRSAHDEGFASAKEKAQEKARLFTGSEVVIYCRDHELVHEVLSSFNTFSWGYDKHSDARVIRREEFYQLTTGKNIYTLKIPFTDNASIENCLHCVAVLIYLNYSEQAIQRKISLLKSVPMRLELKEGINQCQVIDDTYNNDLGGLQISLQFLANQHQKKNKTVILSDVLESGMPDSALVEKISVLLEENNIQRTIGIGKKLHAHSAFFRPDSIFYETTDEFLNQFPLEKFHDEIILVKGARVFQFERIVSVLQRKVHGTIMEIDLGAVVHNLNYFRSLLKPTTRIMVMVKAFAYGSGSAEIANVLQYHKVDYLGVAYADEGVDLRKNNIKLPIMVMNPSEESFDALLTNNLEPEMYSFRILQSFLEFLSGRAAKIHVKLDTGMHRLGFEEEDIKTLASLLAANRNIKVASIFSHMAGADEAEHDNFSNTQAARFQQMADELSQSLGYKPICHILNSPGIMRLPEFQFDMVRLGIGLYGVDPTSDKSSSLKVVATLKTVISQIKHIKKGETVGYGRRGKAEDDMTIGTIAIGYADGYGRAFSRGVGEVLINGKLAKVIGNVCMDMTMVNLTGIDAKEGDEVTIFGESLSIHTVAGKINTIPYEILTNTSERVKRVFVAESI
jgi:Alr-MurF fusion protein